MGHPLRLKRAKQLGASVCPECEKKEIETFEKYNELPYLIGTITERDIARKIRFIKLHDYPDHWDKTKDTAAWWIAQRNNLRQKG